MARVIGGAAVGVSFDALPIDQWLSGTIVAQTPASFRIAPNPFVEIHYVGTEFAYDTGGNLASGTIAGIAFTSVGLPILDIENITISIPEYRAFVASGNTQGLLSALLSGNDAISTSRGSAFAELFDGFAGNDSIDGAGGADTLRGGSGNDRVLGGSGDDSLNGGIGADGLFGGDGNDALDGADINGADTLIGGIGDDTYNFSNNDVVIESIGGVLGGTDTVIYSGTKGGFTLGSNLEQLVLASGKIGVGNSLDNVITGNNRGFFSSGDNRLFGLNGNDSLTGDGGDDILHGGKGSDTLNGGEGRDLYIIDNIADVVRDTVGNAEFDTVKSLVSFDLSDAGRVIGDIEGLLLTGSSAINGSGNSLDNTIIGNRGRNQLAGQGGADILDGGAGADTLDGGDGDDTYRINSAADIVIENGSGRDMVISTMSVDLNADGFKNIEDVALLGNRSLAATGNDETNSLSGNVGANRLLGGGGDDILYGKIGNDTLDGGAGADELTGGAGNDVYVIDEFIDFIAGEQAGRIGGVDTVLCSVDNYILTDNLENLTLLAGAVACIGNGIGNRITGNDLDNELDGDAGNDTLIGGAGRDTLFGGPSGKDVMIGGAGDDSYFIEDGDRVTESRAAGDDTVAYSGTVGYTLGANLENLQLANVAGAVQGAGNSLGNRISGNASANRLRGFAGNDTLIGGSGNNTLDGGAGADSMVGGAEHDTYIVDNVLDVVAEADGGSYDKLHSSISFDLTENGSTVIGRIEELVLTGNRAINGNGNDRSNTIIGNSGANILDGGYGSDGLEGAAGNDSLYGGWDASTDFLSGGMGNDTMAGGDGDDFYRVHNAGDVVLETGSILGGNDTVISTVSYTLPDNLEDLRLFGVRATIGIGNGLANVVEGSQEAASRLFGLGGDDTLICASFNDTLDGGAGNDSMSGGTGSDVYHVDSQFDVVAEAVGEGIDTVIATSSYALNSPEAVGIENLTLAAGIGLGPVFLTLTGNNLANLITDNEGHHELLGNDGNDTLLGGAGSDSLDGGSGNDSLVGGIGNDTVIGGSGDDTIIGGAGDELFAYRELGDGRDLIREFDGNAAGGQDIFDLDSLFDALGTATADRAARVQVADRGANVEIHVDTDNDGTFEHFAATLQTADVISVATDLVVGTL